MRLTGCYIENFGALQNYREQFDAGCNVVCKRNGWGKSTLAAFIRVMFFGFEGEGKKDDISNERRRYAPWQKGVYGGEISFVSEGKEYVVKRTFGSRKKEDDFVLYDAKTQMVCKDFSENIGEELFGVDSRSFVRTVFISERDCLTYATDDINKKISNNMYDTTDEHNYEAADRKMVDYINKMSPSRKTGNLYRMKERLTEMKVNMAKKDVLLKELKELEEKTVGIGVRCHSDKMTWAVIMLCIILVTELTGIGLLLYDNKYGYALMFAGVVVTYMMFRYFRSRRNKTEKKSVVNESERTEVKLLKHIEDIREQLVAIEGVSLQYDVLSEEYKRECKKYDNVVLAREFLKKAKLNYISECMPDIRKWFETYHDIFGKADFRIDADINIYADEKGMFRNIESISLGRRDVAGVCMRMALAESMYVGEKPFIILDDPFMGIDDESMDGALEFIRRISERFQVIYFTCHRSRVPV